MELCIKKGTNVATMYCSDCSRAALPLQENSANCGLHVDKIQFSTQNED